MAYKLRRLKGAGVLFVLLWNLLLFSYHQSAVSNLVNLIATSSPGEANLLAAKNGFTPQPWQLTLILAALSDFLPKLFYPFAGWLADAKLGRYKVMRYSLWVMWIGSILLIFTSILNYVLWNITEGVTNKDIPIYTMPVYIMVYIINALGIAGYHVNIIPFGIDQMEGPSGEQIASFVHWYYWTRNFNFGVILQFIMQIIWSLQNDIDTNDTLDYDDARNFEPRQRYDLYILLTQMFFLTAAVSLDFLFSSKLFKDAKIHNPVKKVKNISAFIFKHGQAVGRRSAYTFTYDTLPARSDFAKKSYGGPFEDDAVEDVSSFWRMVLFLLPVGFGVFLIQTVSFIINC